MSVPCDVCPPLMVIYLTKNVSALWLQHTNTKLLDPVRHYQYGGGLTGAYVSSEVVLLTLLRGPRGVVSF
jgi:hypothetical protein